MTKSIPTASPEGGPSSRLAEQNPLSKADSEWVLDTSGWVWTPHGLLANTYWEDLSPFEQGYIEALFADGWDWPSTSVPSPRGFSDLSPEALAAIRKDCSRFKTAFGYWPLSEHGAGFWKGRQDGRHPYFPPVSVSLTEEGEVAVSVAESGGTRACTTPPAKSDKLEGH